MASGSGPPPGMRPGARDPFMPEGDWGNIFHNPNEEWSTENLRGPLAVQDPATDLIAGQGRSASQPPPREQQHFIIERYCILCRDTIPVNSEAEDGSRGTIHFYDASTPGGPLRFSLHRCNGNESSQRSFSGTEERDLEKKKRCRFCPNCSENNLEKTENMIHVECLQLAKQKIRRISVPLLARVAHLLRPVVPWTRASTIFEKKPGRTKLPQSNICQTTDLGRLLVKVHRVLPGEVQRMICEYLPGTLFFSLSSCLEVLDWIEEHRILKDAKAVRTITPQYPLMPQFSIRRLVADTVNILGEICLARIGGDAPTTFEKEIPVKDVAIRGVEYALGIYGVVGLRVLYEDGSYSPWLGSPFGNWFKVINTQSLRHLCASSDGLKIVLLDNGKKRSAEDVSPSQPEAAANIFWEKGLEFAPDEKNTLVNLEKAATNIRGSPGSRIARYLSLRPVDGKEVCLSVYANPFLTARIRAGSDALEVIKNPDVRCQPITLILHPGETVKSVHLVVPETRLRVGRFSANEMVEKIDLSHILIHTSNNRTFLGGPNATLFNPEPSNFDAQPRTYKYIVEVGHESEMIAGFFADFSTTRVLHCFGVTSISKRKRQPDQEQVERVGGKVAVTLPRPLRACKLGDSAFLTKANLVDVKELYVQSGDEFISGLLIRRNNGSADTLGSWDPYSGYNTRIIYPDPASKSNKALQELSFTFGVIQNRVSSWNGRWVMDISLGRPKDTTNTFVWDTPSLEVAWWFTDSEHHLEYWDGEMVKVEVPRYPLDYQQVD